MAVTGKSSGFLEKARAVSELVKLDLVFGAGVFVVAGDVLALGHLPPSVAAVSK